MTGFVTYNDHWARCCWTEDGQRCISLPVNSVSRAEKTSTCDRHLEKVHGLTCNLGYLHEARV